MNDIDKIISDGLGKFFGVDNPITPNELVGRIFTIRVNREDFLFPNKSIVTNSYYAKLNLIFAKTYRTVQLNTYLSDVEFFFDGGISAKATDLINFLYKNPTEDLVIKFTGLPNGKVSFGGKSEEIGRLGFL